MFSGLATLDCVQFSNVDYMDCLNFCFKSFIGLERRIGGY